MTRFNTIQGLNSDEWIIITIILRTAQMAIIQLNNVTIDPIRYDYVNNKYPDLYKDIDPST